MQAQTKRQPEPSESGQLTISISGDRETVARLIANMASTLGGQGQQAEPAPLYVTRDEAARRTGLSRDRLSNLVKLGQLRDYGTGGRLKFNLAEVRAWLEGQAR
jgi:excisionase family DNA binding protein